jgi:hypothetical protein
MRRPGRRQNRENFQMQIQKKEGDGMENVNPNSFNDQVNSRLSAPPCAVSLLKQPESVEPKLTDSTGEGFLMHGIPSSGPDGSSNRLEIRLITMFPDIYSKE